jgi:Predicted integral membrane protein
VSSNSQDHAARDHVFVRSDWQAFLKNPVTLSVVAYTAIIFALIFPTLGLYTWAGHDQLFPVIRIYELCKLWRVNGPFHAPWQADWAFGYGYPFYTFYAPLGYYAGALSHFILGLDYGPATKFSFYASLYLSGLLMYALVYVIGQREQWPRLAWWALGGATVFALTRYHLTDVFVRNALAECWAWPTLVGVFLGAEIARRRPWLGALLLALMQCGLMLSHNVIALYGTIAIGCYVVFTTTTVRWPVTVMIGGALGAAMAAFFWLPALVLVKLTNASLPERPDVASTIASASDLHLHALYWQQHFVERLGIGGSIAGPDDPMGINLGIAVLIGIVLAAIAVFRPGLSRGQRYRLCICLILLGIFLFAMSPQMNWARVPAILRYVQFSWRLLIFTAFFGCLATVMASPVLDKWFHPLVWVLIAALIAIPTLPAILNLPGLLTDRGTTKRVLRWYDRQERGGWFGGAAPEEYWPLTLKAPITDLKFLAKHPAPANRVVEASAEFNVEDYKHEGTAYLYKYNAPSDVTSTIGVVYFPGWELRLDGQRQPERISMSAVGLVNMQLPAGSHTAELKYTISPIGRTARIVSCLAWAVWLSMAILLAIRWWRKDRRRALPLQAIGAS